MILTPQANDFAKLILKHYGKTIQKDAPERHEHIPISEPLKETENVPKTNKDKYSIDYSKWETLNEEEKAEMAKNIPEDDYRKMFGCFHDRRKERQLYEKSTKEKLEAAERFKQEGNKFFKNKDYIKADVEYQKALIQFDYTFADTPEEEIEVEKLQEQCHTNMALVKFHMKDYKESIQQCNLAIKINKNSLKARYRKACAYLELDDYQKVELEIKDGLEVDPKSADFIGLKDKLETKIKQYEQKNSKVYKRIFDAL